MTMTEPLTRPVPAPVALDPDDRPPADRPPAGRQPDPGPRWRDRVHAPSRSGWIVAGIALLAVGLYTWGLSGMGSANSYYAAAVKSGSVSWKAWFFGSIDPGSFITVDKPPLALWVMGLSARIFGYSTWSMLLPDAAAGVGSVLVLHRLVRRWAGDVAAHLASLALALTPVAALMFRFNNPDALLTLLCLGAAWALWNALESGRTRHLLVSAGLVGLAFNTKMLQAFLVLPAFALVYAIAGPPKLGRRLLQLLGALVAVVVASSWWVAIVALWPASSRPWIGSTSDNSILSLVFGYNGLGRIFGGSAGNGGGANFGGTPGALRLFNTTIGGQVAWLIPLALAGLVTGLWLTRRHARTDLGRAGWLLWGGWALTCAATFSLSEGTFHPYYVVQLAPAIAALAGAGGIALWRLGRQHRAMAWALPVTIVGSAAWAIVLLDRSAGYATWLKPLIIGGAVLSAAGIWVGAQLGRRALVLAAAVVAAVTLLAGPAAYTFTTVANPTSGNVVNAGPTTSGSAMGAGGVGGTPGGGSGSTTSTTSLVRYLEANRGGAEYLVATFGSQSSASIIIESGQPVVTIGGFNGSDPAPSLAQLQAMVSSGQLRYVLVSGNGGGGGPGGGSGSSAITSWVTSNGKAVTASAYGGTGSGTLYDVSAAA